MEAGLCSHASETFDHMFTMSGFQAHVGFGNKYVTEVQ